MKTNMAEAQPHEKAAPATLSGGRRLWPARWRWRVSLILLGVLLLGFAGAWLSREQIAGNLIDDAIGESGLQADYEIESIGAQRQILRDLVIGDPSAPDLTAERVIVEIVYVFGSPQVGQIHVIKPRLYGSYRNGTFSLGSLDSLLFAESEERAGLPALDLKISDGRARIESDFGVIGAKLAGEGRLDDGFAGTLAATAPGLGTADCALETATLYGELSIPGGEPQFEGPVRLRGLECAGVQMQSADITANVALSGDFAAAQGAFDFTSQDWAYGDFALDSLAGGTDLAWNFGAEAGDLTLRHDVQGSGISAPNMRLGSAVLDGNLRASAGFDRAEWNAAFTGEGAAADLAGDLSDGAALAGARDAVRGTMFETLLNKFERGLSRSTKGGQIAGDLTVRRNDGSLNLIIPEARLRSASGETVLALSRISYARAGSGSSGGSGGADRLSGNFLTGGADLPRINGRMEQVGGGDLALRMTMAEYRSGAGAQSDAIGIPRMEVRQDRRGRVTFNGLVQANGAIPGGSVRSLELPVEGTWSSGAGLAVGRRCTNVRMAGLTYAQLTLAERQTALCPALGSAMITYRDALNINVVSDDLQLAGELGGTPTTITAARAVMRYPGPFEIAGLTAQLGPDESAVRLSLKSLQGAFDEEIGGSFSGASAAMDAVPLDLSGLGGVWSYQDSVLDIGEASFILTERTGEGFAPEERFEPLLAQGASLTLEDGRIRAQADLRSPASGTLITSVTIGHELSSGRGRADIAVPGIRFDDNFQPTDLSELTRGVIALAEGTVTGEGLITWTGDDIESSGTFRTDDFDFAAAFGPVNGVKGEIEFTDLVALTTAPSQVIEIGSVNPGVEALGGRIIFSMTGGEVIEVEDGRWPFMGGELILRPTTLIYGGKGGQRYTFEIVALDAAVFVAQMELTNLGATGVFDGTIPIYFDALGNGSIEGGLLISRAPGGNVAYVGELTYEDMGAMANYAFQTLRSLDYRQMSIELNGDLAGEILTNFNIDGVRQGEGTSQNFVTRELAKLPIRFKINVKSDNFYLLATIVRGLFDPTVFGNPADQGLFETQGGRFVPRGATSEPESQSASEPASPALPEPETPQETADVSRRDEPAVQPPESDDLP